MSRLQPRIKALPGSNLSPPLAHASKDRTQPPKTRHIPHHAGSVDPLSNRATLFLIRRTLCSQLGDKGRSTPAPIDELLPPLTSSNEVDLQLYAFIAIIIREFVQTWYSKITPDQVFVEEVVKIIAHCTRALEQRLRKVDLESLLFDELPELLEIHIQAYRVSHASLHPPPFEQDSRQIYHSLWPFPALSPVPGDGETPGQQQVAYESMYRQLLIQGVLALLLPTEDLENKCLTSIVGEIFSEMILGSGIGVKASEPWILWEVITKVAEITKYHMPKSKAQIRVERSIAISQESMIPLEATAASLRFRISQSMQKNFWLVLQYGFLAFTALRFLIITVATSSSLPSRNAPATGLAPSSNKKDAGNWASNSEAISRSLWPSSKQPILAMKIWSCASTLLDLDARMPWLRSMFSMVQWGALMGPGKFGNTDGMIDKILSQAISTHVLDPAILPTLLRNARAALFPNNLPAPARPVPDAAAQLLIRRRCAESILALLPPVIRDVFFGASTSTEDADLPRILAEIETHLDAFADPYCNKHLLYGIVELIIVRVLPEISEKGIEELLEERLS